MSHSTDTLPTHCHNQPTHCRHIVTIKRHIVHTWSPSADTLPPSRTQPRPSKMTPVKTFKLGHGVLHISKKWRDRTGQGTLDCSANLVSNKNYWRSVSTRGTKCSCSQLLLNYMLQTCWSDILIKEAAGTDIGSLLFYDTFGFLFLVILLVFGDFFIFWMILEISGIFGDFGDLVNFGDFGVFTKC